MLLPLAHAHVMLGLQGWLQTGGIAWLGTLVRCAASALLRRLGLGALLLVPSCPRPMRMFFCCVEMEVPIQWLSWSTEDAFCACCAALHPPRLIMCLQVCLC